MSTHHFNKAIIENKEEESTLANTLTSSVHYPENDLLIDTDIKDSRLGFKETLEQTKLILKKNEYTANNSLINNSLVINNNSHYILNNRSNKVKTTADVLSQKSSQKNATQTYSQTSSVNTNHKLKNPNTSNNFVSNTTKTMSTNHTTNKYINTNNNFINNNFNKEEILCSLDDLQETNWNQFEDNSKLYKVNSTYDEKYYNTTIDESNIPENVRKAAEQIEKELKFTKSKSHHINEERGLISPNDESEETKYSSVFRNTSKKSSSANNNKKSNINCNISKNSKNRTDSSNKLSFTKVLGVIILLFVSFVSYRLYKINKLQRENKYYEDSEAVFITSNIEDYSVESDF